MHIFEKMNDCNDDISSVMIQFISCWGMSRNL